MSTMVDNNNPFDVVVLFRVQANPPEYLLDDFEGSKKTVLSLINQQVETNVNDIVHGDESPIIATTTSTATTHNDAITSPTAVQVTTSLLNLCHDDLPSSFTFCANFESTIQLDMPSDTGFLHYDLVKELRQLVAANEYPDTFDSHVTWLGPYWTAADLGWRVDGPEGTVESLWQHTAWFGDMAINYVAHRDHASINADNVDITTSLELLDSGGNNDEEVSVELSGTIYGTCDCTPQQYQEKLVELFNEDSRERQTSTSSFLTFLRDNEEDSSRFESVDQIQAFAPDDDLDIRNGNDDEDNVATRSSGASLKFFNAYHVAGGLFSLFVLILLMGCCYVIIVKKRRRDAIKNEKCSDVVGDEEDGESSCNSPETSVLTSNNSDGDVAIEK